MSTSDGMDYDKLKLELEADILEEPANVLSKTQLSTLHSGFAAFDNDGSGTIDYAEFEDIVYNVLYDEAEAAFIKGWQQSGGDPSECEVPPEVEPSNEEIANRVSYYLKLFKKTAKDEITFNEYCVLYGPGWLLQQHKKLTEEQQLQNELRTILVDKRQAIEERRAQVQKMPRYSEVYSAMRSKVEKLFNAATKKSGKEKVSPKQVDAIFKRLHTDWVYQRNDQHMTMEELLDLIVCHKVTSKVFPLLDTDEDGNLSYDELRAFHKLRFPNSQSADERFQKRFARYDKDGSGLLSYAEAFLYLSTSLKDLHEKVDFELQQVIEEFALVSG